MPEENKQKSRRRFLEVEEKIADKVQVLCFLKGISMKRFVTETMEKELEPYEGWLENVRKLRDIGN